MSTTSPGAARGPLPVWIYLAATAVAALAAVGVIFGLRALSGESDGAAPAAGDGSGAAESESAGGDFNFFPKNNTTVGAQVPATPYRNAAGDDETLDVYRGQPLVVNFWASTCAPCITEMPEFEEVFQTYSASDDVAFIGVNFGDTADAAQEMVELTGVTYDIGRDLDRKLLTDFGSTSLPTTALVDPDGRIVEVRTGPVTKAELGSLVEALLAE